MIITGATTSAEDQLMRGVVFLGGRKLEFQDFPARHPHPARCRSIPAPYSKVATPRGTEYFSHQTQSSV